ncbi:hypothetical protein Hanom_Chr14g01263251 [Helianthus anomalus]
MISSKLKEYFFLLKSTEDDINLHGMPIIGFIFWRAFILDLYEFFIVAFFACLFLPVCN